ncbi:uncharacterized protein CTRU02_205059 [Colletotrichum truncatum]|uniref:Uncharacterized protein n=1 Tax=Colletotrichum truncatum TaxID=5467 RepID=A0ACC3Z2Y0_COLTU|nr:uncharacterized protein CTRU02_06110 [Colletotrichum truncatum]KAF6793238.1 hypothetical protein CTRU02_06110 [Colletotrichum truncatum]
MSQDPYQQTAPAPAKGGSFKDRNCPNMRNCWSFSWEAYSLKTSDKTVLLRRICMYIILGIRTALSILSIASDIIHGNVAGWIIGIILAILGFFFIAWCLAVIGQAEGRRKVLGIMLNRVHFDIFLLVTAFIHAIILVSTFFGLGNAGSYVIWLILWLLIFAVAWICNWPAEPESSV